MSRSRCGVDTGAPSLRESKLVRSSAIPSPRLACRQRVRYNDRMIRLLITPLYAGLLGLAYLALSGFVVAGRRRFRVSLGTGGNPDLERRIRVHGNFGEYVPLALVLLVMLELNIHSPWILHVVGLLLVVGRVGHVAGVAGAKPNFRARTVGVLCTFAAIAISSALLLFDGVRALVLLPGANLP